jgi:hypothetical protein
MNKVKIEVFLSVPNCSGGVNLTRLLNEIQQEFGDKVEIVTYKGRNELFEKYNLTTAPALIIGGLVRIMGLSPSKESLISALKEAGLE